MQLHSESLRWECLIERNSNVLSNKNQSSDKKTPTNNVVWNFLSLAGKRAVKTASHRKLLRQSSSAFPNSSKEGKQTMCATGVSRQMVQMAGWLMMASWYKSDTDIYAGSVAQWSILHPKTLCFVFVRVYNGDVMERHWTVGNIDK